MDTTEQAMAAHSSTLAWRIPWMEEPGRLQSMGSLRVRHDWLTSLSLFTFMHWRRQWQPTPVFLPGESQEQRSLLSCHLWTHSSILAWRIPGTEEPVELPSMNLLQCSCLENPRNRGACWAAVYGVAQSQTRLTWLSSSLADMGTKTEKEAVVFS